MNHTTLSTKSRVRPFTVFDPKFQPTKLVHIRHAESTADADAVINRLCCHTCLRAFTLLRAEHHCGMCGEAVCRKCLTKVKTQPWRAGHAASSMKVCKPCSRRVHYPGNESPLQHAQSADASAAVWVSPEPHARRVDTPTVRTKAYSASLDCATPYSATTRDNDSDLSLDSVNGADDEEMLTLDTHDMKKVARGGDGSPMFLSQISSSIREQRELLRQLQRATAVHRNTPQSAARNQ